MLSDICHRSTSTDRDAVDAFLPHIEPDTGKNLDALAEAKPHTQFLNDEQKRSVVQGRPINRHCENLLPEFHRIPALYIDELRARFRQAHAKTLVKIGDLTQSRKDAKMNFRREIVTTEAKCNTADR